MPESQKSQLLKNLGIKDVNAGATIGVSSGGIATSGKELISVSPIDGKPIAAITQATLADYEQVVAIAAQAFVKWRMLPAPARGQVVREIGQRLRDYRQDLGALVTLEAGKITAEGIGEVQEMIDIGDFAVGLSRQLYGLTMPSERPEHRLYEQWHPLGIVGVITAFNFPVAVWSWNALIAAVCGDATLWKPSSKTPLTAVAVQNIIAPVLDQHDLGGVFNLVIGSGAQVGDTMLQDACLPLISATGSCRMGQRVATSVAGRFGRSILELGGNNAIIICEDADLDMAVRAVLFGAVGTAGQRCTSTRRLIVQHSVREEFLNRLVQAYRQISIGDPRQSQIVMGPLIDQAAVDSMLAAMDAARTQGGDILTGGRPVSPVPGGFYVQPAIMAMPSQTAVVKDETFAPLLYVMGYDQFEEALMIHNDVPQGLSSAIFTNSMRNMEAFLSARGSDCGIANVNIGTSGAEIGGAFGGEKETGGGREAGSDSWKAYMRRQTCTINWGTQLPLAQGIRFES